jgi:hypothetical protein
MIFCDSDTVFLWANMTDSITGAAISTATVNGVVLDSTGTTTLINFSFSYDGSLAQYEGTISAASAAVLVPGSNYIVQITAVNGGNTELRRETHNASYNSFSCG